MIWNNCKDNDQVLTRLAAGNLQPTHLPAHDRQGCTAQANKLLSCW